LAFVTPYVAIFVAFVIYPIGYGLWLGSDPASYRALFGDPVYPRTVVNTLVYLLFGVNLKLLLALLLSGFFMRKGWWTKFLLLVFMLPWAMPALSSYLSINWMLNGQWGLINNLIWQVAQVDGPPWLDSPGFALGSVIYGHIWKWLPFWTLIFLAGRMAVPVELYEAADVDGASGIQKFTHVTLPLMAGMYLVCTMLSTIWALGDFNAVRFISGGGPALSTHVLATLGIRNAFELGDPKLGMATVLTALPLLIPLVILLMRQLRRSEVTI
jgi:multiple sugar transport system permease protein